MTASASSTGTGLLNRQRISSRTLRGMGRIGEGHVSTDDPNYRPGMSKQEIVDQLCRFAELGVTFSSVPAPRLNGAEAYMDHAQCVIEEIKPHVAAAN